MKATLNIRREQLHGLHIENYKVLNGGFHFHTPIELLWVRKGAVDVWINDTEATVHENELAIVLSYDAHQFHTASDDCEITILFVPTDMCQNFMDVVQNKRVYNTIINDKASMEKIGTILSTLVSDELNSIEQAGYVQVILGMLLNQSKFERADHPHGNHITSKLLFYINEHYKEDISASIIAQELGYNVHHISKSFRSEFQIGIMRYVNTLRLKNAILLMRQKEKCITDCAMESGFSSLRTFYRIFNEEFGCTPREYMQQL